MDRLGQTMLGWNPIQQREVSLKSQVVAHGIHLASRDSAIDSLRRTAICDFSARPR
jgi:hypothetical protein